MLNNCIIILICDPGAQNQSNWDLCIIWKLINNISMMYGDGQYLKSGIWGAEKSKYWENHL